MAFDGAAVCGIKDELKKWLTGGRIYKIYQPENDEICLVVKNRVDDENITKRLVISANASLPMVYISSVTKENPDVAPNFCMLLRKHIGNGRITDITQPDFERILVFTIEHLDELGDVCRKRLYVELMGKHSNIIFTDDEGMIIDSIKHVSFQISSVREVLPGRAYVYPPAQDKLNPLQLVQNGGRDIFINHVFTKPLNIAKAIYTTFTGISPVLANEIAYRAGLDGGAAASSASMDERERVYNEFENMFNDIAAGNYDACIAYDGYTPMEFSVVRLSSYAGGDGSPDGDAPEVIPRKGYIGLKSFDSVSQVIEEYYRSRSVVTRIKQRSTDLRRIVSNAIERTARKLDLQQKQLKDTEKRDKYRVYGELITAFGYSAKPGDKVLVCENYYTNEEVSIPLEPDIPAMETGKKYFEKYNKLKRTCEALTEQTKASAEELTYLQSVANSLDIAASESDLQQIKAELVESGYIKGRIDRSKNKKQAKSKPLHYISSDGYHMYVGKNNFQNDELTFKLAAGGDLWFHAKQMPGSHVIVKTEGETELPDSTYEEAARLAAFYSTGKDAPKVDIDYTARKNLKKPPKAKPGYVIYHTNYSMTIEPDIHGIREV
jgi:predicted ribosome quality control (RQC) complex YloA/Tae2 family protein